MFTHRPSIVNLFTQRSTPNVLFFQGKKKCVHFFSPDRGDCRSRKMLQNEYLIAKFGFDTAQNESRQVLHFLAEKLELNTVLQDRIRQLRSGLAVLDFLQLGSSLSLRVHARLGSCVSLFACSRFGSSVSVLRAVLLTRPGGMAVVGRVLADFSRFWQTLDGPFSAVSTATIARIGAFCSFFQDLQD